MDQDSDSLLARLREWLSGFANPSFIDQEKAPTPAFVLGIISFFTAWLIPLITIPLPILGLYLSMAGRNSSRRKLAISAGILCAISVALNLSFGIGLLLLGLAGP